jgi:hypothetical protein
LAYRFSKGQRLLGIEGVNVAHDEMVIVRPTRPSCLRIGGNVGPDYLVKSFEDDFQFPLTGSFGSPGVADALGGKEVIVSTDINVILPQVTRRDNQDTLPLVHDLMPTNGAPAL